MNITKRQLAVRFVGRLEDQPLDALAPALIAAAREAGYAKRDMPSLIAAVERELARRYGSVEVRITTAHQTPAATQQKIADQVAKAAGATSHSYVTTVDPELIGGFEATAGDTVVHESIHYHLTNSGVSHA